MPTQGFDYRGGRYYCEQVDLARVAEQCGTPCYVYSASSILENYRAYNGALGAVPHEIHYAVKANSSIGLLALLAREGAGFDIVSGGELFRVLKAGGDPAKVVFSGVGKSAEEIRYALDSGIGSFNCESEAELELLNQIAGELGLRPNVALRVNPDIDADTHPYIATGLHAHKFGVELCEAERIYGAAAGMAHVDPNGVSCHIGSQIFDTGAFYEALDKVVELAGRLRGRGLPIRNLDLGGGLAVAYRNGEATPSIRGYASRLAEALEGRHLKLMLEPGRSIVGQAGILLTTVLYRKRTGAKEFVIVDAAMNDLIRPALYQAHHEIVPLHRREASMIEADVVGPVCESGDFLARGRRMPDCVPGEILAVCTVGAYGFVQSSNYNSRPRPPEVLVEGGSFKVIRNRETRDDLIRGETANP
jgi:diaminopimelate decarboxylase